MFVPVPTIVGRVSAMPVLMVAAGVMIAPVMATLMAYPVMATAFPRIGLRAEEGCAQDSYHCSCDIVVCFHDSVPPMLSGEIDAMN